MFSIGEFSKITGLTVKTLRFYHEQGVLVPSCIDDQSGYRYYDRGKIEVAGVISRLRQLDFSLTEIAEILRNYDDDVDILHHLVQQREAIASKLARFHEVDRLLSQVISQEQEARARHAKFRFSSPGETVGSGAHCRGTDVRSVLRVWERVRRGQPQVRPLHVRPSHVAPLR